MRANHKCRVLFNLIPGETHHLLQSLCNQKSEINVANSTRRTRSQRERRHQARITRVTVKEAAKTIFVSVFLVCCNDRPPNNVATQQNAGCPVCFAAWFRKQQSRKMHWQILS